MGLKSRMFFFAGVLSLLPGGAFAALSGYYDSAEQIAAILASAELADSLHQLPLTALEFAGESEGGLLSWSVRSADCAVTVTLQPRPPEGIGKTTYTLSGISACE